MRGWGELVLKKKPHRSLSLDQELGGGCWLVHFYHSLQAIWTSLSLGRSTALNYLVLLVISRQWDPAQRLPETPRDPCLWFPYMAEAGGGVGSSEVGR